MCIHHTSVYACAFVDVCVHVLMYVHAHVCACIDVCVHVLMCVCARMRRYVMYEVMDTHESSRVNSL